MSTPCCWGGLHTRDLCPVGTIGTHLSATEVAVPWETFPWHSFPPSTVRLPMLRTLQVRTP